MKHPNIRQLNVYLVEDHVAVRQGVSLLLAQENIAVCGESEDLATAIEEIRRLRPHVVLVDLSLGDESGHDLLKEIAAKSLETRVLVYSMHEDLRNIEQAFKYGARAYVSKREMAESLVNGVKQVARGETYLSPRAARVMAEKLGQTPAFRGSLSKQSLSRQEQRVYELIGKGHSTDEISDDMNISPKTVESYYSRILLKKDLRGMRELRRHAIFDLNRI